MKILRSNGRRFSRALSADLNALRQNGCSTHTTGRIGGTQCWADVDGDVESTVGNYPIPLTFSGSMTMITRT